MSKILPERPYFTLSGLAKSWDCTEEDILHDGIYRQLKICVISAGWELQEGYYLDEGHHIPIKERWSNKEILQLKEYALREILSCREAIDPEFVFEQVDVPDQGTNDDEYECFLSSVVLTQNMEDTRGNVIVRKSDLIIKIEDAEAFLADMKPKTYDLSYMKPEACRALVLDYAIHVWEEYRKETGSPPQMQYVLCKIEENEHFIRTKKNKNGDPKPTHGTITKEITEDNIRKEIQSRKNAQKRG